MNLTRFELDDHPKVDSRFTSNLLRLGGHRYVDVNSFLGGVKIV